MKGVVMSASQSLNPSIEQLHKAAKVFLERCKRCDAIAIQIVRANLSVFRFKTDAEIASALRLCHVQEAMARSEGFANWAAYLSHAIVEKANYIAMNAALSRGGMQDRTFRAGLARSKSLPEIGTSRVSEYGVRYDVTDYSLAHTPQRGTRIRRGEPPNRVDELMPVIAFPEMSNRLYELYIETDSVTSRPLVFIDTMADTKFQIGLPNFHQVTTPEPGDQFCFLLDAARIHETILAHELGHIWVEMVERIEDFRHPKDQSDLAKITQFYHIQSFVMDLRVNDMLERRGFDMSIIAGHQVETIHNFAANCARGEKPSNPRVLAGIINSLAGALLEMERFPAKCSNAIKDSIELIQRHLPEAFEPARGFVESVLRHGYDSCEAVKRVVDECCAISFAATGEAFDPETDLIDVPHEEPAWDKHLGFLPILPRSNKREVFRRAAQCGVTGTAKYEVAVTGREHVSVLLIDSALPEPIRFGLSLDVPMQPNWMPNSPLQQVPIGSAYIPPSGLPYNGNRHSFEPTAPDPYRGLPQRVRDAFTRHEQLTHQSPDPFPAANPNKPWRGPQPDQFGASAGFGGYQPPDLWGVPGHPGPGHNAGDYDHHAERQARIQRQNEEHQRQRDADLQRHRLEQMIMSETLHATGNGQDLRPALTEGGENYAKLNTRKALPSVEANRNYMAGVGLFLSRVGFEQQMAGEHPYGYANNNPVMYNDPLGTKPRFIGQNGPDCKERANVEAGLKIACDAIRSPAGQSCINRLGPDYRSCINNWCNSDVSLACGSKGCVEGKADCTRAITNAPSGPFKCFITICTGTIGNPLCWKPCVTNTQQQIGETLIHEAMHCCGMHDHSRDGKDPNNPAEDVARCIMGLPGHQTAY